MTKQELLEQVNKIQWMHTIDLGDGVVTPGKWPTSPLMKKAFEATDFKGKKVLDIGTCSGLWSFEAEKRGASEVYSIDYLTHVGYWCSPEYRLAHKVLKSKAIYNPDLNIYDIEKLNIDDFDIIIFSGLYYHLKHPLLAFSKLRRVLNTGGKLIVEGPVYPDEELSFATFHYHDVANSDRSNWWCPSTKCLREWIECSFFNIERTIGKSSQAHGLLDRIKEAGRTLMGKKIPYRQRIVIIAEAVTGKDPLYATPDDDLVEFMKQ